MRSAVARRVFFLFVVSAFVPAAILAALSYSQVREVVQEYAQRQLKQAGSAHARALYDRLLGAQFILNANAAQIRAGHAQAKANDLALPRVFRRVYLVAHDKAIQRSGLTSAEPPPRIDGREAAHMARGATALLLPPNGPAVSYPWLGVALDPGKPEEGVVVAELDPAYLWGNREEMSYQTDICVLTVDAAVLYCSNDTLRLTASSTALNGVAGNGGSTESWVSAASSLFLRPQFGADDWTVVALRPGQQAFASLKLLAQNFLAVTLLALLLVALLSVVQIRRTLVPLERLIEGTQRIAREVFTQPVEIERNDEFGQLASSLNNMSGRLGRQIGAMRALSAIDQGILSHLDLDQIIERVLTRLLELFPQGVVGIVKFDHLSSQTGTAYVRWRAEATTPVRLSLDSDRIAQCSKYPDGVWWSVDESDVADFVSTYAKFGASLCFVVPIFWRNEVRGVIAIGVMGKEEITVELGEQVRDLGNRIGVAQAAFEREAQLVFNAHHDDLTGLPNRVLLRERLHQELAHARRNGRQLALLFLDLDRFKSVNDAQGHDAGDQLLRLAADRLKSCVRECDTVARVGGDEFVVMLTDLNSPEPAARHAEQVVGALSQAFQINSAESFIGASIGVSMFPADGVSAEDLLKHADIAMYKAKAAGRGRFVFFEESMNLEQRERAFMEGELRLAIARDQLSVHYQPRFAMKDGRCLGAEALVRWHHPVLGWVSPARFIPLAENVGLIDEIGPWVLQRVCSQLAIWQDSGYAVGTVAVNVSARQLKSSDLISQVKGNLESTGLAPNLLEIEITEGALIDDIELVIDLLGQLKKMGVSIALDDFGTGYSSMTYLRRLPLDVLKIDQAFVRTLTLDSNTGSIVQAIIAMAHALNKSVVAEGVETVAQVDLLRAWGCDTGQGYYFSRPVVAEEFERMLGKPKFPG